ncbi:MAG: DUF1850 domain-containing protein [Oscillospiraceae bacterium]|nr:DUF1850 domain-containing protein [Oscillospiraceae bacterium]
MKAPSTSQLRSGKSIAAFAACAAAAIALLALLWPVGRLSVTCGGEMLIAWPIDKGERFEITFTHSLNLSPITDVVEWTGSDLVVVKSIFKTFGAGVPVPADGVGSELVRVGDHYELLGIDKHMQSISILLQETPDHHLSFNGREASLLEAAGPGSTVEIKVSTVPRVVRYMQGKGAS